MNRTTLLPTVAAAAAAIVGLAVALPSAHATDFQPEGTCAGTAIVHQTKGVAADFHTFEFTVNGVTFPAGALIDGYAVAGHPSTVVVTGRYWKAENADTSTREDAASLSVKTVTYPTDCTTTSTTTTTTTTSTTATTATTPPLTLPPTL